MLHAVFPATRQGGHPGPRGKVREEEGGQEEVEKVRHPGWQRAGPDGCVLTQMKRELNPLFPTGQFMAPKLVILTKCFMNFYFSKCCFNVSLCRTRCEFGIAIMFRA